VDGQRAHAQNAEVHRDSCQACLQAVDFGLVHLGALAMGFGLAHLGALVVAGLALRDGLEA